MQKCGMVLLQDLENVERTTIFLDMEKFSKFFLQDRNKWWPEGLPWPSDPLHQWSREFEYPYAFYHIKATKQMDKKVLDAGSGITFFPFYLSMHGYDVSCVDNDARLQSAFTKLNEDLPKLLKVKFAKADLRSLPYEDNTFSHICCISVLEHMLPGDVDRVLREFKRLLVPGGICILSVDVFLREKPSAILRLDNFDDFLEKLNEQGFATLFPVETNYGLSDLLSTIYFRQHNPALLPWRRPISESFYHRVRYWIKTRVLRREMFEPLGVAAFALINQK